MKLSQTQTLLAAATAILVGHAASAAIVVEETFTYADGAVEGLNGGTGFSGAWGAVVGDDVAPIGSFSVDSGVAIYSGNNGGQIINTQARALAAPVTVTTATTVTVSLDVIIGPTDGQAGRGIGLNFTDSSGVVFTIGKRINGTMGLFADGIGTGSAELATVGNSVTSAITAEFTYDGTDTAVSISDVDTTANYTFTGQQISFDGLQLIGYHQSTTGNGIDNIAVDVSPVPEPGSLALLALGGLMIARRRRA